jgi:hypothetical protein
MRHCRFVVLVLILFLVVAGGFAQQTDARPSSAPPQAHNFDVKAAVDAYLASVPADARARSDAYFEGGYWLILWDFLCSAAIALFLLAARGEMGHSRPGRYRRLAAGCASGVHILLPDDADQ